MNLTVDVGDITILLLASAFALLIAILALKNEIQTPRSEIKNYERNIRRKIKEGFGIVLDVEDKIRNKLPVSEAEYELFCGFATKSSGTKDVREGMVLEAVEKLVTIRDSKKRIEGLDECYDSRCISVFRLTVLLFILGIISLALDILKETGVSFLLLVPPLYLIFMLLFNSHRGYKIEKELIEDCKKYEDYLDKVL